MHVIIKSGDMAKTMPGRQAMSKSTQEYPPFMRKETKMETNILLELWNNGGIPLLMAAYIWYQSKLHREEISELRNALNEQTKAMTELISKQEMMFNECSSRN